MTAMTHARDVRREGASTPENRGTTWSVLVVTLLALGYALSAIYLVQAQLDGDGTLAEGPSRTRAVVTADVAAALPFLMALLVVGRDWRRRIGAVVVAAGVVALQLSQNLRPILGEPETVRLSHLRAELPDLSPLTPTTSEVLMAMAVPALVALAWGIARRRGRWWPVGVIVAAGLGFLVVHQRPPLFTSLDWVLAMAVWAGWSIAPAVVGGVVSWWLEHMEVR
jgi:hypothetical protein